MRIRRGVIVSGIVCALLGAPKRSLAALTAGRRIKVTVAAARAGGQVVLVLRVVNDKGEELLGGGAVPGGPGAPCTSTRFDMIETARHRSLLLPLVAVGLIAIASVPESSEAQRGGPPGGPPSPRAGAPIDLTGYWVSLVTEDWRFRVTTPPKGDYTSVPLNPAGRKVADAWDPAKDDAAGEACRGYGVGGVMRLPGRLRIGWQDDRTIKIETDAGTQTRLLVFSQRGSDTGDWQGTSLASWDRSDSVMGAGGPLAFFGPSAARGGSLKVVTTKMKPGYLRKNGVPYSGDAVITEYFDRFDLGNGDALLVVSTEVIDPTYLAQPFWTSSHFKKQNDASGWKPTTCSAQ